MSENERRLAAVMFTDIVGYTALTQVDESTALQLLEKHKELVRPILSRHRGREVKTVGDAFLVEFTSALEATECAVEVQKTLADHNASSSNKVEVRIGVHVGDVVHREGDIYGDAVNIAARIEPLARGGEVCISEQVYAQVRNKVPYRMERLPSQTLKNVQFPIDVYRIVLQRGTPERRTPSPANRIAVLPLSNISPDQRDAYFADGMTEELITVLSQVQGLRVIARTSVDRYKGREKRITEIGQELEVGSVMEGSVRMAGDRLRVTVQLIDASNEEHVWAKNYDRKLEDVFAIQSDIAHKVADALKVKLLATEQKRLELRGADSITAYTAYLRGRALLSRRRREELVEAKETFETAISLDPKFAPAFAGLADAHFLLGEYKGMPLDAARQKSKEMLAKALEIDPDLSVARASLGRDLSNEYRYDQAEAEFRRAISLNPSYTMAHMWYAAMLSAVGRTEECLEQGTLAEESDPLSVVVLLNLAFNLGISGRLQEAEEKLRRANALDPGSLLNVDMTSFYRYATGDITAGIRVLDEHPEYHNEADIVIDYADLYAAKGDMARAKEWFDKFLAFPESTFGRAWFTAVFYGEIGDRENFFLWANRAVDKKEMRFEGHKTLRSYQKVKDDPRWAELLARANLRA